MTTSSDITLAPLLESLARELDISPSKYEEAVSRYTAVGKWLDSADSELAEYPAAKTAFEAVREIPQVVDGIRCNCGCAEIPGFYSLLSCYEGGGMARICEICQGEGRLAARLYKSGKTLDEIRTAIDARYA